ncbi:MAG: hypothetical protein Kow0099_37130 [Candidatus Abyssubacteria bacterium]
MKAFIKLLLTVIVSSALFLCGSPDSHAATIVKKNIAKDAVWSLKQSPYVIPDKIALEEGVSLTIEPGVRVEFGPEATMVILGKLTAIGAEDKPIVFTGRSYEPWGNLHFTDFSDNAVFSEDGRFVDGCILKHCVIEGGRGVYVRFGAPYITQCIIRNNFSSGIRVEFGGPRIVGNQIFNNSTESEPASGNGGGIIIYSDKEVLIADNIIHNNISDGGRDGGGAVYAYAADNGSVTIRNNIIFSNSSSRLGGGIYAYKAKIEKNTIVGNRAAKRGGGIFAVESQIRNNTVQSNTAEQGGGLYAENSEVVSNSVLRNKAQRPEGGGIYYFGSGVVLHNTLIGNEAAGKGACGGVYLSGNPSIHDNNIYSNSGYALYVANVADAPEVDATDNFWGIQSVNDALRLTFDWLDNDSTGLATCVPYLEAISQNAPAPPPSNLLASASDNGVKLWWETPTGIQFDGHRIYCSRDKGYPYDTVTETGPQNSCYLKDLEPGVTYFIAVSGFRYIDGNEIETGLSEEISVTFMDSGNAPPPPPTHASPPNNATVSRSASLALTRPGSEVTASRWQLSSSEDFTALVLERTVSEGDLSKLPLPKDIVLSGQRYFWRAACLDPSGGWSEWSSPTAFRTAFDSPSLISGPISGSVTLSATQSPYTVTGNMLVLPGATLSIEPGVRLRFSPGANLMVQGKLIARGRESDTIVFTRDSSENWGHLIFADQSEDAILDDKGEYADGSIIEKCVIEHGKGIVIESSSPVIVECDISNNKGSGIVVRHGGPIIVRNDIHHNAAPTNGGGVYAYTNDIIRLKSNKIRNNRAGGDGGGIFAYGYMNTSAIRVEDNDINSNEADGNGGGVYLSRSSAVGNRIESNQAGGNGGGIFATFGLVDSNEIRSNHAAEGGGIFAERNSSLTRNYVAANEARSGFGGGVYINFWGASIENESFVQNTVTTNRAPTDRDNGGVFVSGFLLFEENNIFDNVGSQLYNANESKSAPLVVSQCYWGVADKDAIAKQIMDGNDNPSLGLVNYEPFLPEPVKFD